MKGWKDRLATLFLVLALGLSLVPWVYRPDNVVADPPDYICSNDFTIPNDCGGVSVNCFCPIIIKPK